MNDNQNNDGTGKIQESESVSFLLDRVSLARMDEMMNFYNLSGKDELLPLMVEKYYEHYLLEKGGDQDVDEIITDIQNRLGKIEDKLSKIYEPLDKPLRPKAAKSKPAAQKRRVYR